MINADTAIVGNGTFFHYCHNAKGLMALRIHWKSCPLCRQTNPDYVANKLVFTVINLSNGNTLLIFSDQLDAINYIQNHPLENLALGDTGYVDTCTK